MCLKPALGHWLSEKTILGDRVGLASDDNEVITHPFELRPMAFLLCDRSVHAASVCCPSGFYRELVAS